MIFGKGSKIYSIVTCKCPKCHEGRMFPAHTLYHPAKFNKMNARCEVCNQSFEPEPGFYFGSMFVSYGVNTAFFCGDLAFLQFHHNGPDHDPNHRYPICGCSRPFAGYFPAEPVYLD